MSAELLTAQQVGDLLGISADHVQRLTRSEKWPCVRLSSKTIRYRSEHVEQIVAAHEVERPAAVPTITGQTARSKKRAS